MIIDRVDRTNISSWSRADARRRSVQRNARRIVTVRPAVVLVRSLAIVVLAALAILVLLPAAIAAQAASAA
jgi:hypothetical protein